MGDALIFPFLTIHKALPNITEDRLRVSLDNRYQRVDDPIAEHMLKPHLSSLSPLTWQQVYQGWTNSELQYYWESYALETLPKITEYLDRGFDEAVLNLQRPETNEPSCTSAESWLVIQIPSRGKTAGTVLSASN